MQSSFGLLDALYNVCPGQGPCLFLQSQRHTQGNSMLTASQICPGMAALQYHVRRCGLLLETK